MGYLLYTSYLLTYLLTYRRTDGETSDIYINPAPHAVSVNSLAEKITLWLSRVSRLRVQHCSLTTGNKI